MPELHLIGEVVSGLWLIDSDQLFCRWRLVDDFGKKTPDWTLLSGKNSGTTQIASSKGGSLAIWNHPIDAHYALSSIRGWPRLFVQVWRVDKFGRQEQAGYGFCHIPTVPGEHDLQCVTWRPTGSISMQMSGGNSCWYCRQIPF